MDCRKIAMTEAAAVGNITFGPNFGDGEGRRRRGLSGVAGNEICRVVARAWSEASPIGRMAARKLAADIWTLAMTGDFRPLSGDGVCLKRRGLTCNCSW